MPRPIYDRLTALADPIRARLLLVLERGELTVGELCSVVQLPQSTVSRQLKALADERWITARAEGTSRFYAMITARLDDEARALWSVVRESISTEKSATQDAQRMRTVLAARRSKSQEFFSSSAGQWDRLRGELFGKRSDLQALLALLDREWVVGDLGCGTGHTCEALAPFVRRVIAVDESGAMLSAAKKRLAGQTTVELRKGHLEALPIEDRTLDAGILSLVLHYVVDPERVLAEAARTLKPGGRLIVIDMMPHDREEYRQSKGHLWQGFSQEQLEAWMITAELEALRYTSLQPDSEAKGPTLFVATALRRATGEGIRSRARLKLLATR